MLSQLSFRYPFRKYQRLILQQVEAGRGDRKYHIVAPPGSGKTIVGIELIRQFDAPAVVFAPTTTIQQQWQAQVGMFADADVVGPLTSLDPNRLAPINIFTYQLISTPGQAQELAQGMARQQWLEELLRDGQAADEAAANARLVTMRSNNPREYDRELARRYLHVKHALLREGGAEIGHFLHPNARELIERLVEYGVRTVVLDECHHLLDYWAIVLRYLIGRIDRPSVVGLTATLPSLEDGEEYENYTSLLGEVDFEVPTPAVVKEGDLAPYRDLAYFTQPSERERAYLHNIQQTFEQAIADVTGGEAFRAWVARSMFANTEHEGAEIAWETALNEQPLLSLAALRFLLSIGHTIPPGLPIPQEANEPPDLEDWLLLLERYVLDKLKVSANDEDHKQLSMLRRILLPFGITITERGLRQTRSPGDLVLALSESKDEAVAHIVAAESAALGERLRAVVVTDFERMTSGVSKGLQGVLEGDAGSAIRVFRHLASDPRSAHLRPVLATGSALMVGAEHGSEWIEYFNLQLRTQGLNASCDLNEGTLQGVAEVVGAGRDWSSRTYVRMVTAALEEGLTRCLVGTRGIFGEGWDSLRVNTLIDLTGVTTSTSVQQLRGRSIRLDPGWPRKVAHNWDVICVAPEFKRGEGDLRRFEQRHARYWGVVPVSSKRPVLQNALDMTGGADTPTMPQTSAAIVKGVSHVDADLAFDLATRQFQRINFGQYTNRMLGHVGSRGQSYEMWGVGKDYSNFSYTATRLTTNDLKVRTVFTVRDTLRGMLREFAPTFVFCLLVLGFILARATLEGITSGYAPGQVFQFLLYILLAGLALTALLNARAAYKLGRALLLEQRTDAILLDVGRALLAALKKAEMVSKHLQEHSIRVVEQPDDSYMVLLDDASEEDTALFIRAYRQIFEPVRDQRYLILRDDSRLLGIGLAAIWLMLRPLLRGRMEYPPAYHPVPDVLAARKERAEAFAYYWKRYVGGGQLIFTRNDSGRRILLQARAQRRPKVSSQAFEVWR
ncbi:MAG TPA: DEAD/DEAH box helicase family protein [Chloroflexia bacterium]|nr:DEAD/DEAH box helicase family protein [Chloroflexia bacterium]